MQRCTVAPGNSETHTNSAKNTRNNLSWINKIFGLLIQFQHSPQSNANDEIVGSEECLWLNIFTPQMPDETTGLPVIVFIHGGGYRFGSANQYTVQKSINKTAILLECNVIVNILNRLTRLQRNE